MSKLPPLNPALEPVWLLSGRKSHPDERDDQKLTEREQRESCLAWARRQIERAGRGDLDEVPWEFDDDTGQNAQRPAYQRRLARARALRMQGRQVYWLVRMFDRIGRDGEELFRSYKELCALDVELHDVSMGGYVSPQVFPYLVANAHVGSVTIGANVKRTNAQVRRDGWWRPARRPWGFAIVPATKAQQAQGSPKVVLAEHPDEAAPCRQAWTMFADGATQHAVERYIAALPPGQRGEVNGKPRSLGHQAVGLMFRNPLYAGLTPAGEPGHWPALVSAEVWAKVQARLAQGERVPAQARGDYLLTGLLWCPYCQQRGQPQRMRGSASSEQHAGERRTYRRYRCSATIAGGSAPHPCYHSVVAELVERDVLRQVHPLLVVDSDREYGAVARELGRLLRERQGGLAEDVQSRLAAAQGKIDTAKAARRVLMQKLAAELIADDEFREEVAPYRQAIADGERERAELAKQAGMEPLPGFGRPAPKLTVATVMGQFKAWQAHWLDAADDVARQRPYLAEVVARIEPVRGEYGEVHAHITWTEDGSALAAAAELALAPGKKVLGDGADTPAAG